MEHFYFHVRSNGHLVEDQHGRQCADLSHACAFAIRRTPSLLSKVIQATNTYVTTEISNRHKRTVCVVRATIVREVR